MWYAMYTVIEALGKTEGRVAAAGHVDHEGSITGSPLVWRRIRSGPE